MSYVEKGFGAKIKDIEIPTIKVLELIIIPLFHNNKTNR
jgi:hypothetical protein